MRDRLSATVLLALTLAMASSPAASAELVLEAPAVLQLVQHSLFKRDGKLDLQAGPCYAFLETPSVTLQGGRLAIRSHLSARVGAPLGGQCLGPGFAASTSSTRTISGR